MLSFHFFALNASHSHHALACRCLADAMRAQGYDADFSEADLKTKTHTVLTRLYEKNAHVYGFSCYIWNLEPTLALARDLKALRPECRILLGGPEVSFDTDRFTSLAFVDTVICGEGEEAVLQIGEMLTAGEALPRLITGAPYAGFAHSGIHYHDPSLFGLLYYESSRGCPFSCAFCLSGGTDAAHGVRAKTAERALADLLEFEHIPAPVTVKLVDRTFNYDKERAKTIWRGLLSEAYTKCYHFEVAAHLLDEESLEILSRFPEGKVRLEIGLQSANKTTLAAVARHTAAEDVLRAARRLTEAGNAHVHLDLIAGLPYEDYASFAASFDAAYPCCHVLQLGFLKLLHGTALRRDAAGYGMVAQGAPPYTVLQTAWLSFTEVERLRRISDLMERLRDSGRFCRTLDLLIPDFFTPFAFYEGFCLYLDENSDRELHKISQRDLFLFLSDFAKRSTKGEAHAAISEALRADFSAAEVRRPPAGL